MSSVTAQYHIIGATASAIAGSIEAGVAHGQLPPGTILPSVRTLAGLLEVSPATVAAAYRDLRARGVVAGQERKRTRIAARPPLPHRSPPPVPPGVRDLTSGNPDPALLPSLQEALRSVVVQERLYGEPPVVPELAAFARQHLADEGVDAEHLTVVHGALDGLERVLAVHCRTGDRVAVEDPGYTGVLDLVRAMGLTPVGVPIDAGGMIPGALDDALRTGVDAVVVTPRAHNPTGAAFDAPRATELRAVLDGAPDVLVVEDDHAATIAGTPLYTVAGGRPRRAYLRSLSKSLAPDLRAAVLAGDRETIARVEGRHVLGPGWVSTVIQRVALCLWSSPPVRAQLGRAAATYAQRRDALTAALEHEGIGVPARSGLNVWVPVTEEEPIVAGLLARGWAVRAGETFRLASPPAVRITIATLTAEDAPRVAADLAAVAHAQQRTRSA